MAKKERALIRHVVPQPSVLSTSQSEYQKGIVASVRENYCLVFFRDEYYELPLGAFRHIVVGDEVTLDAKQNNFEITGVLPQKTFLARLHGDKTRRSHAGFYRQVIAANVDRAVIVAAATEPEFHPRFIDRYLIVCQDGNVQPIIAVSKADLTSERHPMLASYRMIGIPVVEVSVITGQGLDELKALLRNSVSVLVGSSGVGKSSLINALMPGIDLKVNEVSATLGKGRHTTTSSDLYQWDAGSLIIDTPGIRALGLEDLDKQDLPSYFPEFSKYAERCKFGDCTHSHEPACAVRLAVESGQLSSLRYESYLRLLRD